MNLKLALLLWANSLWVLLFLSALFSRLGLGALLAPLVAVASIGFPYVQALAASFGFWWAGKFTNEGYLIRATVTALLAGGALASIVAHFMAHL